MTVEQHVLDSRRPRDVPSKNPVQGRRDALSSKVGRCGRKATNRQKSGACCRSRAAEERSN